MDSGVITLISVVVNALVAVVAPLMARRMATQQERLAQTEQTLGTVSAGLQVIEQAVEENKDALARTGAGDRIAQTIRTYGPAARNLVDTARTAARDLSVSAREAYEAEIIRREHEEHDARVAAGQ